MSKQAYHIRKLRFAQLHVKQHLHEEEPDDESEESDEEEEDEELPDDWWPGAGLAGQGSERLGVPSISEDAVIRVSQLVTEGTDE